MRKIDSKTISNAVSEALIKANKVLPDDVYKALNQALDKETSDLSKDVLGKIILNADIAKDEFIPMCQDTGMVVCFVKWI